MKQLVTRAIVLSRTDYDEADRIVTVLTPDHGKLRLMVRGARKLKSKLAGGIELFSVSDVTYIKGRGDIDTLISGRLHRHYGNIVKDIDRVQLGYDLIKQLNKVTEDQPEEGYFDLLNDAFAALDDPAIDRALIITWFQAQLLRLGGHVPNLQTDNAGQKLALDQAYDFDHDGMTLTPQSKGGLNANHIKLLRLLFGAHQPRILAKVHGLNSLLPASGRFVQALFQSHISHLV